MPLTQVTLGGTFKKPDGTACSGAVRFRLAAPILDGAGNVIVAQSRKTATLDVNGSISIALYATEGTGLLPTNNAYVVEEALDGVPRRTYEVSLPASDLTPNLADYTPVTSRPTYEVVGLITVVAGGGISIDATDPANPIVSTTGGGGTVESVVAGAGISVNSADPTAPVVTAEVTQAELDAEAGTRGAADTALDGRLDVLEAISFATDAELLAHVDDVADAHDASAISYAGGTGLAATDVEAAIDELATEKQDKATFPVCIGVALSDPTTAITATGTKETIRAPFAFTLTEVRASLTTASSSGTPTVDVNEGGVSVLSTKLTIDANEKTSETAATPAVISDSAIADDAELTFDIDVTGTGAVGLKVWLIGTRSV